MKAISNRYEIIRKIGSGSIGDVFLVRDLAEGQDVCLKLLSNSGVAGSEDLGREFTLLTRLRHPGLIRVLDFGVDDVHGSFFTMEYACGGDLVKAGVSSPDEFFKAASSICQALDYIHSQGVIHGDLKPSNILKNSSGDFLLADFGLAFVRGSDPDIVSSGSAAFISPELLRKESVSPGSDIYSLGLLFFEMIFGKPFFEGTAGEIIGRKLSGEIQLPPVPEEYGGSSMHVIMTKMLYSDPKNRHQSAGAILDEISDMKVENLKRSRDKSQIPEKAEFVGRVEEMNWLEQGLQMRPGEICRFFFIGGDSGVGKSRLLDEFRVKVQIKGVRFFRTYCREGDLEPFGPLVRLLNYIFVELDPTLEIFSSYGPDLKRLFPAVFEILDREDLESSEADIKAGRRRMFDNLLLYLDHLFSKNNLIITIEDLQWADRDTLDFVEFLWSNRDTESSFYFICTGRTVPEGSIPAFLTDDDSCHRVLESAGEKCWQDFLNSLLGGTGLPDDFSSTLHEETGGNFLYAEEILKELISDDCLIRRRGKWFIEPSWEENVRVPEGVLSLLNRRLERLSADQILMAGAAAVLNRSFRDQEIIDLSPIQQGQDSIEQLIAKGVFKRQIFGREEKIYFGHGQLRRAAYDSLPDAARSEIHANIACYYEKRNESSEFLGRHYASAGDNERGYQHLSMAAQFAMKVLAFKQAADLYAASLKCAEALANSPDKNERLYKIHLGRGQALNFISPRAAQDSLMEAVSIAQSCDSGGSDLSRAAIAAGRNSLDLGESDRALELLQEGLSAAESVKDKKLQGEAKVGLGFVYDKVGRLDDAEASYLEALDLFAGVDYPEGSCRVLNYLGIARKRRGDLAGAEDFYRRSLDICLKKGFRWAAMNLYGNLGNLYSARGQTKEAGEHYTRSLEISRQISDRKIESINLLNIGHALNQAGDLEAAESKFFEALDKHRALGDKGSEAITLNNLGFLYFRKGEIRNSLDHYEKGLRLSLRINQPRIELANRIGIAEILTAIADFQKADEAANVAIALAERMDDAEQLATILPIRTEIKYELDDSASILDNIKKFLNLPAGIGEPRQRIKALLVSEYFKDMADLDSKVIDKQIADLSESTPSIRAIMTRFRAQFALRKNEIANPEIWIARLDEAIRKSSEFMQHTETVRLIALKIEFLAKIGDSHEAARQREILKARISKLTAGLDERYARNLNKHLNIPFTKQKDGESMAGKVSREERLEVLFRVARTINTIRESDPLLNKIMDLALETLAAERGFIMLYSQEEGDQESNMLAAVVARNLAQEDIFGETTISRSSAVDVARTGKPLLLSRSDEDIHSRQSVEDFKISSLLCVPLAVKGNVLGIVYIDSRSATIFDNEDLEFMISFADLAAIAIENARLSEKLERKTTYLQRQVESIWGFGSIIGRSSPMQQVFRMAESVAETDTSVVISGESGTGKELLARAIHFVGPRRENRFQPVDCGAVTETLLESELFGHVKGAFTGAISDRAGLLEVAKGGTIFLDEITNTSEGFQVKLLRVLQENEIRRVGDTKARKIDVRVIAATNRNLEEAVEAGRFREDLYYRLNVVMITLPPLRERAEDIPILANYFLENICKRMKMPLKSFSSEVTDLLLLYSWPGNVRQLENVCERAIIFSRGEIIDLESLPPEIKSLDHSRAVTETGISVPSSKSELKTAKAQLEKLFLIQILEKTGGNVMQAARLSGMDRSQLHHMMNKFGLNSINFKS